MDREEAIEVIKELQPNDRLREALRTLIPELAESEDERIRKALIGFIDKVHKDNNVLLLVADRIGDDVPNMIPGWIAYLEKQKAQKSDDVKREWWNKGYLEGRKNAHIPARELGLPSSLDFQQKPNVEIIQRCWYMEGYHDREFGQEPKWIIKTGEGGPKFEKNENYGQPLERKPTNSEKPKEWSEKHIADIFEKVGLAKIVREQANDGLTNAVQDAMLELSKVENAEWSEGDERNIETLISVIEAHYADFDLVRDDFPINARELVDWLKSLRPLPHLKPSEEQIDALNSIILTGSFTYVGQVQDLISLKDDLKKLM